MALRVIFLPSLSVLFFFFFFIFRTMGHIGNPTKLSSIESIKQLKGCCDKGSKVKGVHHLKLYLARFGYLNYQHTPESTNIEDDKFDDEVVSAVKSYQKYYHLNVTGTLDEATVSQMVIPRCGVPDKKILHHGSKSLPGVSLYRFFPNYPRWPRGKSKLTYAFDSDFPDNHVNPLCRAFDQWSSASGYFRFSRVDDVEDADLKVSFVGGDHGDGYKFDGPGGVLAHAFAPTDGRMHIDADENWSDGPGAVRNAMDFESVAVHEIGHLLGLGHSNNQKAVMYPSIAAGVVKGLDSDDIRGIKVLYGLN